MNSRQFVADTETGEITEMVEAFEGHPIDANDIAATGKIGDDRLNPSLHLGQVVTIVARCVVTSIGHADDNKRGLVRSHKLAVTRGGLVDDAQHVEAILERMKADQDAANGTPALPLDRG